jgi:hypothetical protein
MLAPMPIRARGRRTTEASARAAALTKSREVCFSTLATDHP